MEFWRKDRCREKVSECIAAAILYEMVFLIGKQFVTNIDGLISVAGIAGFLAAGLFYEECKKDR